MVTQSGGTPADDCQSQHYYWHAREGQPQEHAGLSCGDLAALAEAPQDSAPSLAQQLHQPACMAPKPARNQTAPPAATTAASPTGRSSSLGSSLTGGGGVASSCLDQYNSMLPDNPVQQLPLLPTTATHTSATVRVAAWLLGHGADSSLDPSAAETSNNLAGELEEDGCPGGAAAASDRASLDGFSDSSLLDELEQAVYSAAGRGGSGGGCVAASASAPRGADVAAAAQAVDVDVEGYTTTNYYCETRRRSLDRFLSRPVQHGDALNNYMAALY